MKLSAFVSSAHSPHLIFDDEVWEVNVQTHSRELACLQACSAILRSGERLLILGSLPGSVINKYFNAVNYRQADSFSEIDCRAVEEMIATYAPRMIFVTAQFRSTDYEALGRACRASNVYLAADITADSGMISAGITESPFEHADIIVSGTEGSLRGPSGALIFHRLNTEVLSSFSKGSGETRSLASAIDVSVFPGHQGGPHNHAIMAVAVAMGQIITPAFKTYQTLVLANAAALKNELMLLGYCLRRSDLPSQHVAVEVEPSIARVLTHALQAISIAHNIDPSEELQIGTQAMTSRGLLPDDFREVAGFLHRAVSIAEAVSKFKATGLEVGPPSREELLTPQSDIRNSRGWTANEASILELKQEVEVWTSQFMLP